MPDTAAPPAARSRGRMRLAGGSKPRARRSAASLERQLVLRIDPQHRVRQIGGKRHAKPVVQAVEVDGTSPWACRGSSSRSGENSGFPRALRPRHGRSSGCAVHRTPSRLRGATSCRRGPRGRARARHRPDRRKSPAASDSRVRRRRVDIAPSARRTASCHPRSAPSYRSTRKQAFSQRLRRRQEQAPPAPARPVSPVSIARAPRGSSPARFAPFLSDHFTTRSASSIVPPPISRSSV